MKARETEPGGRYLFQERAFLLSLQLLLTATGRKEITSTAPSSRLLPVPHFHLEASAHFPDGFFSWVGLLPRTRSAV